MSVIYNLGETKKRPGIYRRQSNVGTAAVVSGKDGICAIPVTASWGPLGVVVKNTFATDLTDNYGFGEYSATYTVPAAEAMFKGGAITVYTYRVGTGGEKATKELTAGLTATAKYPGALALKVAVQAKLSDSTKKQLLVYADNALVETFEFDADGKTEGANLIKASKSSNYLDITGEAASIDAIAVESGALTGGENPEVTNADYSKAFAAFEPYYYNTIALDKDDDENMSLSLVLDSYLKSSYNFGKLGVAVVGEKTTVEFATRCAHAKAFNSEKVVYLGGGYKAGTEDKDGVLAICYTAGVIASTPSNKGITHTAINGATDLCESLTYAQYEEAIDAGMLMLSMSPDGAIWYDTGINTLTVLDEETQDAGWKKIRRTKVRYEMVDRLDRALAPKVGKVSADSDGLADVVQSGQRVLDSMVDEGKLFPGASFVADPANPLDGDSAWFVVQSDDIDSLEKIYEHYQFRYSQNV